MRTSRGIKIKPFCQVTETPEIEIDRVRVAGYKTLFGENEFTVFGRMGASGEEWPVSRGFPDFEEAWIYKNELQAEIDRRLKENFNVPASRNGGGENE